MRSVATRLGASLDGFTGRPRCARCRALHEPADDRSEPRCVPCDLGRGHSRLPRRYRRAPRQPDANQRRPDSLAADSRRSRRFSRTVRRSLRREQEIRVHSCVASGVSDDNTKHSGHDPAAPWSRGDALPRRFSSSPPRPKVTLRERTAIRSARSARSVSTGGAPRAALYVEAAGISCCPCRGQCRRP